MNKPELYFTNQVSDLTVARDVELKIEKETGLELDNPFYGGEQKELKSLLEGTKVKLSPDEIVGMDIRKIFNSDGIVAYMSSPFCIGSVMEIILCKLVYGKPVYVIDALGASMPKVVTGYIERQWNVKVEGYFSRHPWIRYFATQVFSTPEEFITFAVKKWGG